MELFSLYQYIEIWTTFVIIIAIWDLVWKAIALWRAAQRKEAIWFVVILILNTAGILPILYLILRPKPGNKSVAEVAVEKTTDTVKNGVKTVAKKTSKKKPVKKKVVKKKVVKQKAAKKKVSKKKSNKK